MTYQNSTFHIEIPPFSLINAISYYTTTFIGMIFQVFKHILSLPFNAIALLSSSCSITLPFTWLFLILTGIVVSVYLLVRNRLLRAYAKYKDEPTIEKPDPVTMPVESKSGFSSYLDEFLSAIRIFGYLERPVFHELTKSMRSQRLEEGEILLLDDSLGFSIVVEGTVDLYHKLGTFQQSQSGQCIEINGCKYQLLNMVKTGNPISSLASVLKLFTQEDDILKRMSLSNDPGIYPVFQPGEDEDVASMMLDDEHDAMPDIIAKAKEDSTIAIIPSAAFKRLTNKYPVSASHIVQIILTKLFRVTFQTAQSYLGLVDEIFATERNLNSSVSYKIPAHLKNRCAPHTPKGPNRHPGLMRATSRLALERNISSGHVFLASRQLSNPGDLLSAVPPSDASFDPASASTMGSFESEAENLKQAVVEGMFSIFGITKDNLIPVSSVPSLNASPAVEAVFFANKTGRIVRRGSGIDKSYTENIPNDLDYDTAKSEFSDGIQLIHYSKGTTLVKQNGDGNGLFYVVTGALEAVWQETPDSKEIVLYTVEADGVAGYLAALVGSKALYTVRVKEDTIVGLLPNNNMERLCEKYFMIYLRIAESLTGALSPQLLQLDYALEWLHLEAGQTLFKKNDPANGIYIVLNGRLRQISESETGAYISAEIGQGQSVGEVEVLTASKRMSSILAVRESEVARIPRTLFEIMAVDHPSIMIKVSRMVAQKIMQDQFGERPQPAMPTNKQDRHTNYFNLGAPASGNQSKGTMRNYKTITLLPVTHDIPVQDFANKLTIAFKRTGRTVFALNQAAALTHLGRHAFDKSSKLKQSGYFTDLEDMYDTVLYIVDTRSNDSWTQTCITQGDCILLLADSMATPEIGEYERVLQKIKTSARTELILLHPERNVEPGLTSQWLKRRPWVHGHHHIQCAGLPNKSKREPKQTIKRAIRETLDLVMDRTPRQHRGSTYTPVHTHKNDFMRLARILSGTAVGVVLGGGGARGFSHLGVLSALEEQGIPVDMVGGTSMGAFVGGLYAKDYDLVPIYGRVKKFAGRVGSIWRNLLDLTWPVTSYTTGHEFNRGLWKAFGETRIEDFWLEYYCNSTNITQYGQEIHTTGYAWRYIRASMSLAGLLPPIADKDGSMLLDGGYLDNLPVSEMLSRGCSAVFAVDVGSADDRTKMEYGDALSGFWIVFNRWNPFSTHPNVPNMTEIQMRLAYVASVNALEKAKKTPGVVYLRPPIEDYATLDFGKFQEIYSVGASYGHDFLTKMAKDGTIPKIPGYGDGDMFEPKVLQRRSSI